MGALELGAFISATTVITYTYDSLYRLTNANYSTGQTFTYTYDAVGNRLTQNVLGLTTVYTYDIANRLVNAGGITYTWDNNGNLLNDGAMTYAYDSANRPITITQSGTTYTYLYNGSGDRTRQSVNGTPTNYTLDLNAGLTQVLSDTTNVYLYGNGRIAQYAGATPSYFLGDALGSVRQLANSSGSVTLAKSYQPYGTVMSSAGSGASMYGYTGEQTDGTGLVFLRARYYASGQGRFLTADSWPGDYQRPMSFNKWLYGYANPITQIDPSGLCPEGEPAASECLSLVEDLENRYAVTIFWPGRNPDVPEICPEDPSEAEMARFKRWTTPQIQDVTSGLQRIEMVLGLAGTKKLTANGVLFRANQFQLSFSANGLHCPQGNCPGGSRLDFAGVSYAIGFSDSWGKAVSNSRQYTVLHEFGHRANRVLEAQSGDDLARFIDNKFRPFGSPSSQTPNEREYFAETFAFYIWKYSGGPALPPRLQAIDLSSIRIQKDDGRLGQSLEQAALALIISPLRNP